MSRIYPNKVKELWNKIYQEVDWDNMYYTLETDVTDEVNELNKLINDTQN